jgi:hypothetical protein
MNKHDLVIYYDYCKQRKVEVLKSLDIRDLRINALLDISESNIYKECLDNLNIVLDTLNRREKEIDSLVFVRLTNDLQLLRKEMEDFAELINISIQYIEYINLSIKEIIKI